MTDLIDFIEELSHELRVAKKSGKVFKVVDKYRPTLKDFNPPEDFAVDGDAKVI